MRVGRNPEKEQTKLALNAYHRVIIPVYIPNLSEDYFKDGLRILKLCLDSLFLTIHPKTRVSVVNNACCTEVADYLRALYQEQDQMDQLLDSQENLGKVNALYSIIKGNREPLMTIADSDVMFLPSWQQEVEKVLRAFPEAGMVSPVPSPGSLKGTYLRSTIGFAYLNGRPKHEKVTNLEGIQNFQRSIGNTKVFDRDTTKYYTLRRGDTKVALGCGHFMATIRASVFEHGPNKPSIHKIVGGSEKMYIDGPNDKGGYLKLSTHDNFGYHLGNKHEAWMDQKMTAIKDNPGPVAPDLDTDFSIARPRKFYRKLGFLIQKLLIR